MNRPDSRVIVVGVDGSTGSQAALDWAVTEATTTGRQLRLVHAIPMSAELLLTPLNLMGFEDAHTAGEAILSMGERRCLDAGVDVQTDLLDGPPIGALVKAARGAHMLVVGANGRDLSSSLLLGSVSQGCLYRAGCPVVIVKATAPRSDAVAPVGASRRP